MYFETSTKETNTTEQTTSEITEVSTQVTEVEETTTQKDPYWKDYNEFLVNLA